MQSFSPCSYLNPQESRQLLWCLYKRQCQAFLILSLFRYKRTDAAQKVFYVLILKVEAYANIGRGEFQLAYKIIIAACNKEVFIQVKCQTCLEMRISLFVKIKGLECN